MLNKLAPILAPILAPLAPATVLINTIYRGMISVNVEHYTALITSIGSGIGAEFSGMVAAYAAITAWREKRGGHFLIALAAFLVYIALVCFGIWMGENPAPLVITVLISIIAYLGSAVMGDLKTAATSQVENMRSETELAKARASEARAHAREAEAGVRVRTEQKNNGEQPEQPEQANRQRTRLDPERLARVRSYLQSNPAATVREVCENCQISSTDTASRYMKAAQ